MNRINRSIRLPLLLLALVAAFGLAFAQSDDSVKVEVFGANGTVVGYAELDDGPYAIEVEILPGVSSFEVTFGDVTYEGTLQVDGTWWIVDLGTLEPLPSYKVEFDDDPSPRDDDLRDEDEGRDDDEDEGLDDDEDGARDDEDDDLYDDDDEMSHDDDDGYADDDEDDDGDDDEDEDEDDDDHDEDDDSDDDEDDD